MKRTRVAVTAAILNAILLSNFAFAQSAAPADVNAAIRKEGMENSKIMHTLHILTDLYGPRLTGSPNHVNAAKWIASELKSWGFENTALEPWEFGHPGWENERNTGLMLSPVADTLTYEVLAWTPSTKGPVTAEAANIVIPSFPAADNPQVMQNPTQAELTAYLESVKSTINGKIVLVGKPTIIDQSRDPAPKHLADDVIKCRM
ncbi:MAG TPA: hypothetical protein VGQ55_11640, partial [Pyrinomonadaceae bacterium]|nr:hypothetical protein [Pyrinomonadaceae bacterium]